MLAITLILLLPVILAFFTSLKTMKEIQGASFRFFPENFMFRNYLDAFSAGNWARYLFNTALVTIVTVVGSLIINSLAGYSLARVEFRGKEILFIAALLGMMIPPQVTMVPTFIMLKRIPFLGNNDWLGNGGSGLMDTYAALIIPQIAGSFGVFLCRQFYINFPDELDDAAKIDGCGRFRAYVWIYLPLSKSILATLAIIKGTGAWNEYLWPLIMTSSDRMKTVQLALAGFSLESGTVWNQMMAATMIVNLPLVLLFIAAQKYFVEGIVSTGVKG